MIFIKNHLHTVLPTATSIDAGSIGDGPELDVVLLARNILPVTPSEFIRK